MCAHSSKFTAHTHPPKFEKPTYNLVWYGARVWKISKHLVRYTALQTNAYATMHLYPPQNFGCVEDGVYRSGLPSELNYRFLESLNLRTAIVLSPESMDSQFASFLEDFKIRVVYIQNASNDGFRGLSPVAEETVIDALHLLTNRTNLVSDLNSRDNFQ